jgi:hypothetical protein
MTQANLIDFANEEQMYEVPSVTLVDQTYMTPSKIKVAIEAMSLEQKGELASSMDTSKDFPTA